MKWIGNIFWLIFGGLVLGILWGLAGLLLCITVVPFALMLTSYLLYRRHYRLDEATYQHICSELEARRAQAC